MTEQKLESKFHKWYVGGEGEVEERPLVELAPSHTLRAITLEEVLAEYRNYVRDPKAELPEILVEELRKIGQI